MGDSDSHSPPAVVEVSTSSASPQAAIPSRILGIGEGEIQRLKTDLEVLSSSIGELTHGLEQLRRPLVALSESEDPSITAKCWTKQVRALCYDTGDYLYDFMHSGNEFKLLGARALNASGRLKWCGIQPSKPMVRHLPAPRADLIDHGQSDDEVAKLMGTDKKLMVVSIVGPEGAGKTTLAKRLYQSIGQNGTFHCRAFVRASPNPDIRRLLTSMFMQIQRKRPSCRLNAYELIDSIARYLRNKQYFIVIDDLWTEAVWEIITRAFPNGDCGSRIITTTQTKSVALACCGYQSKYVFKMEPLTDAQSENLFFRTVFGSESGCPGHLEEVSREIIRKCVALPLATINIASMLPSGLNSEELKSIRDSLPYSLRTNPTPEWMKEVVNLVYSALRPHLKTCLLYFSMYPEGYIVRKDDLVKQWVVEGFLDGVQGQATEEIARGYFDELVRRGLIQPVACQNGKVLSCTLHHMIHDVIVNKSMEENFVIIADYFQSAIPLPDKARRLSVQFGGARSAHIPESIVVSELRSLAFCGFSQCLRSIAKYRHVRVLILHIWADEDKDAVDLTGIRELLRLRYLKIACNIAVKLPDEIQRQQYLETLEVDATVVAIPLDIGGLSRLSSLKIAVRELRSTYICCLQILPALTTLSVHVKTAPTEPIVLDKGGFLNLKFFTFRCRTPHLLIENKAMPEIEKLNLCFNAHEARQDGKKPITIERMKSLKEISVKIVGAVGDLGSALMNAVTNDPENPIPIVQLMESEEDEELGTLEEQDEIMEEDTREYSETQEKGSGECEYTEDVRDETQNENKEADGRIPMQTGSSSRLLVPVAAVGWGIATTGWILTPIFTRLLERVFSHVETGKSKDNLRKLVTGIIPRLKLILEAAESTKHKVFFEKLVRQLKSAFYELEETLDEVEYDRLKSQLFQPNRHIHASVDGAGPSNQGVAIESSGKLPESVEFHLAGNMKKIERALEEARDIIKLEKLPSGRRSTKRITEVKDRHKTSFTEPRVRVIGREKHCKQITEFLHGYPSVIGICGIAGSGKTTLAQHVYRSEKKAKKFEIFMWIHVSRNFSVGDIFRDMLQDEESSNMDPYSQRHDSLEVLRANLERRLKYKRFLLVLDDIWCDNDSDKYKLYELFSVFQGVLLGSKILVTSRNKNAISALCHGVKNTTVEIQDLSEKDFFDLFMYHALGGNMTDVIVRESLEGIGAQIAKRLKGSPLAAALVGGLLHKEMTVDHWIIVKDDPYILEGIMGILWLCYQHLDEQARRCFAYCSVFPRRQRLERDELVELWVAEGLIEATNAVQMEEIGKDYFDELVATSFMQRGEDSNGGKEYFLIHDLLRDIAEQVAGSEYFRIESDWRGEVPLDVRHLFVETSYRLLMKDLTKLEKLRSLIIFTGENSIASEEVFDDMLKNGRLRKLRVLVIKTKTTRLSYSFPESIGQLKHLRYLGFRSSLLCKIGLPYSFTKLYHMQVLDFPDCEDLSFSCGLLNKIELINLRRLVVQGALSGNIEKLTSLEILPFFQMTRESARSDCDCDCEIFHLRYLHKLRGKLQIIGLEKVRSEEEALLATLAAKEGLRKLVLKWVNLGHGENRVIEKVQEYVLEGLYPSEYLEELEIVNYNGLRYPRWMVGEKDWSGRVQRLVLEKCSALVAIPLSSHLFTNLLRLTFQDCKWKALPDNMENLKKLTVLIMYSCPVIRSLGKLPRSLKYLEICQCNYQLMESCKTAQDPNWEKIDRKFIGHSRLRDPSEYPDEHGVFSSDTSLHEKDTYIRL